MARPPVREERRAQILDALFAVVAERGLMGASVSEIAEAAGIARGALHYFFASKEEITACLMRRLGDLYVAGLEAYLEKRIRRAAEEPSARERIVADMARWHFRGDADDATRRLAVWIDFWGQAASQPAIREVVADVQEAARQVLARALVAQRPELGELPGDALRIHAAALLAVIEGGLLQWRVLASSPRALPRDALGATLASAAAAAAAGIPSPVPPLRRVA